MRRFGTQGRVYPDKHYVVPRGEEIADFNTRVKEGRYIVLFAPRQTGKTTFFRMAMDRLMAEDPTYFPIQLDFQVMRNGTPPIFYERLKKMIFSKVEYVLKMKKMDMVEDLPQFFEETPLSDHFSMGSFFDELAKFLNDKRIVLLIDEFDGIPQDVLSDFLYSLRHIYLADELKNPHSVGIFGVKSISQLNFDSSVSPFNIQDEFHLRNFSIEQVQELIQQYTEEVEQNFSEEVLELIHTQTGGQPFLVNRLCQILTEELDIPKTHNVTITHFANAYQQLLDERNTNIEHLLTFIRRDRRYESKLRQITFSEKGYLSIFDDPIVDELATFGVIARDFDGMCVIVNPIYKHQIKQAIKSTINGLENDYFAEEKHENNNLS